MHKNPCLSVVIRGNNSAFRQALLLKQAFDTRNIDVFFTATQVRCMCGAYPWPAAAVELRHASLPDFFDILQDSQRSVPLLLISCPDLINPDTLYTMAKGNLLVYWCADAGVFSRANDHLPEPLRTPWDSVRVFLPLCDSETPQYHPLFTVPDIERIGEDALIIGLYQAYCQYLRAEDRRAFVTIQDIAKQRDNAIMSALRTRLSSSEENGRKLSEKLAKVTNECETVQKQLADLLKKHENSAAAEYEELLNVAINETDALKTGIARLTARLYTDLGKTYKPDPDEPSAHIQDLAQAIFCCLSRANGNK